MNDKVIFLDIDGVLHSLSSVNLNFERDNIENLNQIIDKVRVEIVISSSWRKGKSLAFFKKKMKENGFKYSDLIIGKTPVFRNGNRNDEILKWLENEDYEDYLAIDDKSLNGVKSYKVDSFKGLTIEDASEIIDILKEES